MNQTPTVNNVVYLPHLNKRGVVIGHDTLYGNNTYTVKILSVKDKSVEITDDIETTPNAVFLYRTVNDMLLKEDKMEIFG